MAWYLAPALAVGRSEVNQRWPTRSKESDGTIGDAAHQATQSDHNPNSRGSVDAWDMDKDGVDVWAVIGAFERHPSSHYWIYNRQIADKDDGWQRRAYHGDNPHTQHVHFSIRQSATAEQDTRPWGLLDQEEGFMAGIPEPDQRALIWRIEGITAGRLAVAGGPTRGEPVVINQRIVAIEQKVNALTTAVAAVDEEVAARLRAEFEQIDAASDELLLAVRDVDEQVVQALQADSVEETAALLRAALGDRAAAVGQLLAAG
ncbi:hypothetical protein [Phytohabitans aurantiacus]|uniref:Uncharacterized protein n=1 Tax=Phytohabitans aurantiacus TaxID=3016789 RepID=A0ABQ5QSV7_9ACTN|nr:hypothetical protein [Phytohabitans aurantiacus]GLH97337.1 hypothetical protein Pa4123_26120 [Phytohabitans aurantiacus]